MTYEEEDQGMGFRAAAVCVSQSEGREEGQGRAKLNICLSKCCLATILLRPIRAIGGAWLELEAGLH